jgi:hypothetical protein
VNRPKVHQATGIRLTGYPGTVRQLVVTGLGRDAPTVIITNDHDRPAKGEPNPTLRIRLKRVVPKPPCVEIRAIGVPARQP